MTSGDFSPLFKLKRIMRPTTANRIGASQGFTLIELLVVMAITVILLGLIFGPMVQGFNLTNRAQVQALTQDTARRAMELIARDVSNGVFVFDNTPFYDPNNPNADLRSINLWVKAADANGYPNGAVFAMPLPYGMVDLVPPALQNDQNATLQSADIDPTTGLAVNRGNVSLPLRPGRVIIRYFLGLRDNTSATVNGVGQPVNTYANYYADPNHTNLSAHNPMILYRAVLSPYLPDGAVDTRFFKTDPATGAPVLTDPNFFYDTTVPQANDSKNNPLPAIPGFASGNQQENTQGWGAIWENWRAISRAVVPTDRADEVTWQRDPTTKKPTYDANTGFALISPLIRFQPTFVGNDAGTPTNVSDTGNEMPNVPPSTSVETYGAWTVPYRVYLYRADLDAASLPLYLWTNTGNLQDQVLDALYTANNQQTTTNPANFYPNWSPILLDPTTGIQIPPPNSGQSQPSAPPKIMFMADARRGLVSYTFPDSVMLHDNTVNHNPTPSTWTGQDNTNGIPAINANFASVLANDPQDASNAYRYVSLASPPSNNMVSPLSVLSPISIVPGSEVVTGPDEQPGPHHGLPVVYTRVPSSSDLKRGIGRNQYAINYAAVPNAIASTAQNAIAQAMENAVQAAGTIIFDSNPDNAASGDPHDIPVMDVNGNPTQITVTYQFQMNQSNFQAKADYLTRQLMTFSLGIQLYEFNSGQPQQVTLTDKINVRNLQR